MKRRKFIQSATAAAGMGITGIPEVPAAQDQDIYYDRLAGKLCRVGTGAAKKSRHDIIS